MTPKTPPFACRCGRRWSGTSRAHGSCCHRTFSGVTAFELHRVRGCPEDLTGLGLELRDGIWSYPQSDEPWWAPAEGGDAA